MGVAAIGMWRREMVTPLKVTEGVRRVEYDACVGVEGVGKVEKEEGGTCTGQRT